MKCFATFMVIAMVVLGTALTASADLVLRLDASAISGLSETEIR